MRCDVIWCYRMVVEDELIMIKVDKMKNSGDEMR